jgi:hypothetical protein
MLRLTPRIAQTLLNTRTWAPSFRLLSHSHQQLFEIFYRGFFAGDSIMDGFERELAGIANSLSDIAEIVSRCDSYRPLQKPTA